ncbi:siphovirus Gp157 family protein [Brucellaceae bacterium C25G]
MKNVSYALQREKEAVKTLMAQLRAEGSDDQESVEIAIESETELLEVISAALSEIDELEILDNGISSKIDEFTSRRTVIRKRKDLIRASVEQAMMLADLETVRLPTATITLRKLKPSAVIDDEALIPSRFWLPQQPPAPKLDKKSLIAALEDGEEISGARLDNGAVSLSVRRK